ncbi:bifunctional 4-hydroxy-2-oxoglutarate aldolase/2-dehydro-3-deoxy-phosphogluconate aldolase [Neobacillus sp. DY30]|uniref:bifunctional 4-hydroxy-2-oxoglutarate aldolase/2-dehydro-3-deoxy-phosphogluconate aldolase n=1 Tax=Neobacillus sp. DY30 TaxID=3047871 RepID=UPI0024C02C77|nr:bifunctional 4-hydroxy-2-oxoglutarate aldolase/2-dehydro-3-deoxy-phosphogluconate aldolase [Neobacillus sp. DY30]WHX99015.1 bifunctional 4-hydroxy-2-oxoglutarate aldolase/2-dehydro-3-deoxy-phosphogluconate aldolase [Neobacillus sp. DY30]
MKIEQFKEHKIISIVRGIAVEDVEQIFQTLYEEGIRLVEVTLNTEYALSIISEMSLKFEGRMYVGAGTVLNPEMAIQAIEAGARFVLTPAVNVETIRTVKRHGVFCIAGALTPTEILIAYDNGSDLVKIFPAGTMGVSYLKDIQGPFPQIPTVPTGGIDVTNAKEFLKAGATALGVGSSIVKGKKGYNETDFVELREKARRFFQVVHENK